MIVCSPLVARWVAVKCECPLPGDGATAIGFVKHGAIVAGVMYERYTGKSIVASIAIEEGTLLNREFIWTIFDYPFNQLAVDKIFVKINSNNKASQRLAKHMGFSQEATIKDVFMDGDELVFSATKQTCKWLEKDYGIESKDTEGS